MSDDAVSFADAIQLDGGSDALKCLGLADHYPAFEGRFKPFVVVLEGERFLGRLGHNGEVLFEVGKLLQGGN